MKIGILQTGHFADDLIDVHGDYDAMFRRLLGGNGFEFQTFNVVDGEFPDGPQDADGWLITGSKHGAYEDHPWIPPLEQLIRDIRAANRPLIGVCFGHQIIAQALGGTVVKFPGGWSVGRQEYSYLGEPTQLNAWHQDQVVKRPEGAQVIGSSEFCENAALLYDDQIFTIQSHPEFGAAAIQGLLDVRAPGVIPDDLQDQARATLPNPTDNAKLAEQMARFFTERRLK